MALPYNLDPGEQVARRINRSIMDVLPVLFASAMISLVTVAGIVAFIAYHAQFTAVPASFIALVALVLLAVAAMVAMTGMYVYRHNYLLITNIHIIKVEQDGLFNEKTAQLELSHVQDVNGSRHGILQTILDYGDIEIETAAAQENFLFRNVASPQQVADELSRLHETYLETHAAAPAAPAMPQNSQAGNTGVQ